MTFINEHHAPLRNNRDPHSSCIYFRDPHSPRWIYTYCVGRYEPWLNSLTSQYSSYGRHSLHTCFQWHIRCLWYTRQPDHTRGRSLFRWLHLNNICGPHSPRTIDLGRTVNPLNTSPHADTRAGFERLLERTTKKIFFKKFYITVTFPIIVFGWHILQFNNIDYKFFFYQITKTCACYVCLIWFIHA